MVRGAMLIGGAMLTGVVVAAAGWRADPAVLLWGGAAAAAFVLGRRRSRRHGGDAVAFWAALAVLAVALASPLDAAAEELFAWHMVQHLLLGLLAPLLLVRARPVRTWSALLDPAVRRHLSRRINRFAHRRGLARGSAAVGAVVAGTHVVVTAAWHVPLLYDLATRTTVVHLFEHASFFASGLALWWCVLGVRWNERGGSSVLVLFLSGLGTGAVAALLTLAPRPLYDAHLTTTARWGLSPLEDQQLAGAIMWVPGGMVYLIATATLLVRWLDVGPGRHPQPIEARP